MVGSTLRANESATGWFARAPEGPRLLDETPPFTRFSDHALHRQHHADYQGQNDQSYEEAHDVAPASGAEIGRLG
jgi:hypothetical protein